MAGVKEHIVKLASAGQRVDNFLMRHLKGVPKSRIYKAIRGGEVRINSGRVKPTQRLKTGDKVRIPPLSAPAQRVLVATQAGWVRGIEKQVIIRESSVMIINKPAGMPVHAGTGIERGLIENLHHADGFGPEWALVHRIDRDTSGCLMLAKEGETLRELQDLFRQRLVKKGYFLKVAGRWQHGECVVDQPLLRTHRGTERFVVIDKAGQPSRTRFRPISIGREESLMWAEPETGRTHQIRVHAASLGHPILGDKKYSDSDSAGRLCLHAVSLELPGKWSRLSVSVLPPGGVQRTR